MSENSTFLQPFRFVLKTAYWGGLLTRLVALYIAYILLGIASYGIIIVTKSFFAALTGNSLSVFARTALACSTLVILQMLSDMVLKKISKDTATAQGKQTQLAFQKSLEQNYTSHEALNTLSNNEIDQVKSMARNKAVAKNSPLDDKALQQIIADENAEQPKQFGSKMTSQESIFNMINKIIEQFLQSLASITVSVIYLIQTGMSHIAVSVLGLSVVLNAGVIWYALRVIKPLDKSTQLKRFEIITTWQDKQQHKALPKLLDNMVEEKKKQNRGDCHIDIFNGFVRSCSLLLGTIIAVLVFSGGSFPLEMSVVVLIQGVAPAIEKLIKDTSIFARSYQELYQSGSIFENIDALMKRSGVSEANMVLDFQGTTRRNSILGHMRYHFFKALTMWAAVTSVSLLILTPITGLSTILLSIVGIGMLAYTGYKKTTSDSHDDPYDDYFNLISASTLFAITAVLFNGQASLIQLLAQVAPTLTQKIPLATGVLGIYYTAISSATAILKPTTAEQNNTKKHIAHVSSQQINTSTPQEKKRTYNVHEEASAADNNDPENTNLLPNGAG